MTEFEIYKKRLQEDDFTLWKERVTKIIFQKSLSSVMNDTKWIELQTEIYKLPFPPPFVLKCVTDEDNKSVGKLEDAPWYIGDWSSYWEEGLPPFFAIEWVKVRPRHGKFRGRLIKDEILDETKEFIGILEKLGIPYVNDEGTITIYGYK